MTDLTSSIYSLVVLATATLALSSYLRNHYSSRLANEKNRSTSVWDAAVEKVKKRNPNFNFSQDIHKNRDIILQIGNVSIDKPTTLLASLLPYAALAQVGSIINKTWYHNAILNQVIAGSLVFAFFISLGSILWILWGLRQFSKNCEAIKDLVDSTNQMLKVQLDGVLDNEQTNPTTSKKPKP